MPPPPQPPTSMEHLIMQIFDRKNWIEEQLRHQLDSYAESLSYSIIAQGKHPPSWLAPSCDHHPKGMLFPLRSTTTPANHSTYFTLPSYKGNEVSRPNKCAEPCASEYFFPKFSDKVVPSACKLNADRITESEVLACAEFVPLESNQHLNSRQRDAEICPSENETIATNMGKSSNNEDYTGRVTQSRARSLSASDVRQSSGINSSRHRQNEDGGIVTRSRLQTTTEADQLYQLSEPFEPVNCTENRQHKVVESESDISPVLSVNLACAEFVPLGSSQHSNSRQRDEEIRPSENEKDATHFGKSSDKEEYTGRVTQSKARSLKASDVRQSPGINSSWHHQNQDGGGVTPSRVRTTNKADHFHQMSEPLEPLNCTEICQHKFVESQKDISPVPSANLNNLLSTTSAYISGTVAMELVKAGNVEESSAMIPLTDSLHRHNKDRGRVTQSRLRLEAQVDSLDKLLETVNSLDSIEDGILKVVESHTEILSVPNSYQLQTYISGSAVFDTTSPVHSVLKIPSVEPQKLCFDGIEEHGMKKKSDITCEKKNQLNSGTVFTNLEVLSVNKEFLCKDYEKVDGEEMNVLQNSTEGVRSINCDREKDGLELLEVENSGSHFNVNLGGQSFHQDVNRKSSPETLAGQQQTTKLKEVTVSGIDCMPAETNSMVEPRHPAFDCKESCGLDIKCSTCSENETEGISPYISYKNVYLLRSAKEAPGSSVQAHSSSMTSQLLEDIFPTVELMSENEEANAIQGQALEERLGLSVALELESITLPRSKRIDSHVPVPSYMSIRCVSSKSDAAHSAAAECVSFSDHQIFMLDGCKKSPPRTSAKYPHKRNYGEKLRTETSCRSIQTISNVQNAGSALPSQTDEVLLEAENVAVSDFGNSSSNCYKISGSCIPSGSVLLSNCASVCLSNQAMGNVSSMGTKEAKSAKTSKTPITKSSQHKIPYLLRSSTSLTENFGSTPAKGSVSCSEKNCMLPPDINMACPENHTEQRVDCSWITPNSTKAQNAQTNARYFLRSRSSHDKNVASFRSNTINAIPLKQPDETINLGSEVSWPKRRKVEYRSNYILATSPKLRLKRSSGIQEHSACSFNIKTVSELEFQPIPMSTETETGIPNSAFGSPSKSLDQSKENYRTEGYPYMKSNSQIAPSPFQSEHEQDELLCDIADRKSGIFVKDVIRVSEATSRKSQNHPFSEDYRDSFHDIIKIPYGHEELPEDREFCNTVMNCHVLDTASFLEYDCDQADFDEDMPEYEGFSISFPSIVEDDPISRDSNLSTLPKEGASALDQLCRSKEADTPWMRTSLKYKIHEVPDVYQSLPAGHSEQMNRSPFHFNDVNKKHVRESNNEQLAGIYGNSGLEFDGSFVGKPYIFGSYSSSALISEDAQKPPLTPPVFKFVQKVVSGQSGANSEKVGSNPELVCFRIDENTSIDDENGNNDESDNFKEGTSLRESKELTNRKPLRDITAELQNKPILRSLSKKFLDRGSLDSVNSEVIAHRNPAERYTVPSESKIELKEKTDLTCNRKVRKAALSLRNRSNKQRVSGVKNKRNRSDVNLEKGAKPTVVSNVSSFIPLVRQKQQAAAPLKGRKDIRIKALEAAEAAKCLEEKKQNEREMRKAAAKLEREEENIRKLEHKQKHQAEERKRKEAEITARKRQREEEGRKVKERKCRCTEETRRQKREHEGKSCADKVERGLQPKVPVEKDHKKEQVVVFKALHKPEKMGCQKSTALQPSISTASAVDRNDSDTHNAPCCIQTSNNTEKVVISRDRLQEVVQTRASIVKESCDVQSYEMSPYRDSDNEDGDDEIRRRRKYIPLWAREMARTRGTGRGRTSQEARGEHSTENVGASSSMTGRRGPGPINPGELTLQDRHRSAEVWGGTTRRCNFRTHETMKVHPRIVEHLVAAGFYGISMMGNVKLDRALLSALVERWRPESHTFHLPVGEMTVSLQDIAMISGLPIDGLAVTGNINFDKIEMCNELLGTEFDESAAEDDAIF